MKTSNVKLRCSVFLLGILTVLAWVPIARGQATVSMDTSSAGKCQTIDGFGTIATSGWSSAISSLYLDDMYCSIIRVYFTPSFISPYSDNLYNSPWYSTQIALPGPQNNNSRTYNGPTGSQGYTAPWTYTQQYYPNQTVTVGAQIPVMGPDIDTNIQLLSIPSNQDQAGQIAALGQGSRLQQLGDFKVFATIFSPAPWLKIASGNVYGGGSSPLPTAGTPFPFIWNGTFAGGRLDVSNTPLAVFNDGVQNTSALTQFARTVAAQLRQFQNTYGVKFYGVSIQNELNFEEFYDSCQYDQASEYIAAIKAVRAELDQYPDLQPIQLMGPEDILGGDPYGMWQYGSGSTATDKNLKFLQAIGADPVAAAAMGFFCIHGYDANGVSSSGSQTPTYWDLWSQGWTSAPAAGLPNNVSGFTGYNKKSWETETSGETTGWSDSSAGAGGFPDQGAFSIALKIYQALTAGEESAWCYYEFTDDNTPTYSLTDSTSLATSPKYVAAKHFFRYIRPNSYRVNTTVNNSTTLLASSFVNDANLSLTTVLINTSPSAATATIAVPSYPYFLSSFQTFTSSDGSLWQPSTATVSGGNVSVSVPGYGVVTMVGSGASTYASWATTNLGGTTGNGGATATPQHDGVSNLIKYLCDISPTGPMSPTDRAALPTAALTTISGTQYLTLTYQKNIRASDVIPTFQSSTDLVNWQNVKTQDAADYITQTVSTNPTTHDSVILEGVKTNGNPLKFVRLNAALP